MSDSQSPTHDKSAKKLTAMASFRRNFSDSVSPDRFAWFHSDKVSSKRVLLNDGVKGHLFRLQCARISRSIFGFSINAEANTCTGNGSHCISRESDAYSSIFLASAKTAPEASESLFGENVPRQSETTSPAVSRGKTRAKEAP